MDFSNTPAPTVRHDGWTPERRVQFLDRLAQDGNVLAACALVGLSREAAYQLRRREPLFARAWAAALALGREASAQMLGTRAIEGIEEQIWHRGEVVGTRRRYDNRLLLAHVARLDRLVEADTRALADIGRFDELLALASGVAAPEDLACDCTGLPLARAACAKEGLRRAGNILDDVRADAEREWETAGDDGLDEEHAAEIDALEEDALSEWLTAETDALARWDAWFAEACAAADRLLAQPLAGPEAAKFSPRTLSGLSSSPPPVEAPEPGEAPQPGPA
ncbi:MAG TPA: hypothetical protein VI168_10195 [Croceibacterium sp.]